MMLNFFVPLTPENVAALMAKQMRFLQSAGKFYRVMGKSIPIYGKAIFDYPIKLMFATLALSGLMASYARQASDSLGK